MTDATAPDVPDDASELALDIVGALAPESLLTRPVEVETATGPALALVVDVAGRRVTADGEPGFEASERLVFAPREFAGWVAAVISTLAEVSPAGAASMVAAITEDLSPAEGPDGEVGGLIVPTRFRFPGDGRANRR